VTAAVTKLGGSVLSSQVDLQGTEAKTGYDVEDGMLFLLIDQLVVQAPSSFWQVAGRQATRALNRVRLVEGWPMKLRNTMHFRAITAASLLACALAIPGSTAAMPADMGDLDAPPPRSVDAPATPLLWDGSASPAPVVVNAAAQAKPAEAERIKLANPLWATPLAMLATTRERPIFSPSRRPPPPAIAPVPVVAAPPPRPVKIERPQLALVGTIAGPERSFGILVDQTTKAALRLRIGEEYQSWRMRAVAPREVTLEHDELTMVLRLPAPDASAAAQMLTQAENVAAQPESPQHGRR
jgi:hypothetical protein